MTWGFIGAAAVTAVAGAYSANQAKKGAKGAANAQQAAADAAYQRQLEALSPYMDAGKWGLGQLQASFSGDNAGFFNSPDYLATQSQGLDFMDRSAAARGSLYSGGHQADLLKYGSNLAAQQLGNYRNGLAGFANMGQQSAQNLGNFAGQHGQTIGNAQAGYQLTKADANSQLAAGIGGLFANYMGQRQQPQRSSGYQMTYQAPSGMSYQAPSTASGNSWMNAYGYR